jgi:penicillin-binding protein 2
MWGFSNNGFEEFDEYEERRQIRLRLGILRFIALAIFLLLGARLYWIQIVNHEAYGEMAQQNRLRKLPIKAPRGSILDRRGVVLVGNRSSYNIVVSREDMKSIETEAELLADHLGLDRDWLTRRFEEVKWEPKYLPIVVKQDASPADIAWVVAHQFEHPELRIEEMPQRDYVHGTFAAHALGYVGEVSRRELAQGAYSRENRYRMGDIVGKSGLERTYNEILMGKDGERIVVVDSRGRLRDEVSRVEPTRGRDLYTTLDFDLQKVAEEQADMMWSGRGAIAVMDPNNGEVLAMVSRPSFDPNLFSLRTKSQDNRVKIRGLYEDENRPLFNRVTQGAYPTGSTWKIFMAVAALNEGVITVEESRIKDGGLRIGNYYMSSLSHLGYPDIHQAIVRSADGYFYRLGLKMGIEKIEKWTNIFRLGQRTGIDLPSERAGIPPSRAWKAKVNPKDPEWRDYDTAAAAIGQGIAITPLQMLRTVAGVATGGDIITPHLLLKGTAGIDRFGNEQTEFCFTGGSKFIVPISPKIHEKVMRAMWGVVNENGTGIKARVEGFDVCGKTGTAQVASKSRAGEKHKDHAWFVSFAPRDKPEIASVVLVENSGYGGVHAAPKAGAIYRAYYQRTRGLPADTPADTLITADHGNGHTSEEISSVHR